VTFADPHELIGKRFTADFRVVGIRDGASEEQMAVEIHLYGDRYELSVRELRALVESGLVTEVPERSV